LKIKRKSLAILGLLLFTTLVTSTFVVYSYASQNKTYAENADYEEHNGEEECWHHDQNYSNEYRHYHRGEMHQKHESIDEGHHHNCG